jgi:hypothetical protein
MPIAVLNYAGNAGVEDMDAFNARLHFTWKGDHLFRVYPKGATLYFIRVGASKQQRAVIGAQFGLLGALLVYFANKRAKKKTEQTLNAIAGTDPQELMGSHKLNFMLPISQVASAEITAGSFWSGSRIGRFRIVDMTGKKRGLAFEDVDNMKLAVEKLPPVLGKRLVVNAEWDERKQKFRKVAK